MITFFTITIAGTAITVSSTDEHLTVLPPARPAYRQFIAEVPVKKPAIEVIASAAPVPLSLFQDNRIIFDGGGVWSLFHCGDDFLLTHNPFVGRPPLWTIHCDRHFTRLTAYCDQWLIQETDGRKTVPSPIVYPLDQIILLHHFARKEGLIVHSTGLEYGGCSFNFSRTTRGG